MKNTQKEDPFVSLFFSKRRKKKIQKKLYKNETQSFSLEMLNTQKDEKEKKKNLI